ncbi:MAG TPA: hypothetical protein VMT54_15025 [Candidatus Cybelea sp.]|nr:hypothetical protein [Candidatus Cybelea sp.]
MTPLQESARVSPGTIMTRSAAFAVALTILVQALAPALAVADVVADPSAPSDAAPTLVASPTSLPSDLAPDAVAVTDPAQIKAKLDDVTIYGRYYDGEDWIEYHLKDGRTAYWEKGCTYPGKWWMQDGQICYAYPNYRNNAPNCFLLFERPDGSVQFVAVSDDGSAYLASFSLKLEHGNTANLPIGGLSPCVGV